MTAHKGGQTCRATEGRREGGLFPRAHLMWQRVCDLPGVSLPSQLLKKLLPRRTEALLVAAGRGRAVIERSNFLFEVIAAASSRAAADEAATAADRSTPFEGRISPGHLGLCGLPSHRCSWREEILY